MGGIPVMRKSTISSCYDDSDNAVPEGSRLPRGPRGSLPVVILESWRDLSKDRLKHEWERIQSVPPSQWDWTRMFMKHWIERIGCLNQ